MMFRVGPEGLYLLVEDKIHVFNVDIVYTRTLAPDEKVPVRFVPDR